MITTGIKLVALRREVARLQHLASSQTDTIERLQQELANARHETDSAWASADTWHTMLARLRESTRSNNSNNNRLPSILEMI